jgi:hypothetical protein
LISFKHMIVGAIEGGLDIDYLWARNPPQDATYPSKIPWFKLRDRLGKLMLEYFTSLQGSVIVDPMMICDLGAIYLL